MGNGRQTYTHSQPPQIAVSAPAPEPIKFEENPDVLATKSAISILMMQARIAAEDIKSWEKLPKPQDVVRMPHINWDQYAVVGESLNKLHSEQLRNPPEGSPQRLGPGGQLLPSALGSLPATPAKDKNEKMGTRKGGKR